MFLYRIFTEKVFCRKDYLFFGLKTDLVNVVFLNSFHKKNDNLFEFEFGFEKNIIKLLDLFWKRKCIATIWLGIWYTNTWYDRKYLTTFPNKPNLLFCPHKIPKLELLYHLRMWARRDLCIGNHLQQSSSTTLGTNYFWSWI